MWDKSSFWLLFFGIWMTATFTLWLAFSKPSIRDRQLGGSNKKETGEQRTPDIDSKVWGG